MRINGLNKTTLLDYPEHVAATVFTGGCNFRCPFCQNGDLVLHPMEIPEILQEDVIDFLKKRKGILSGVCITGGEPSMQPDIAEFIRSVKQLGYLVKLDTNGYLPEIVEKLLQEHLLDYVAMDIKNSKEKYARTAGIPELLLHRIEESAALIRNSGIPYEFRTTVVKELHNRTDFLAIAEWLQGSGAYYLQAYRDDANVLQRGFSAYTKEEMEDLANILRQKMNKVEIRGMD